MNGELLCRWLGLSNLSWPPEPHTLLGVPPDGFEPAQLEQRVQERMARLRCYQISHPEEATEGMNRVAQAFVTLTERGAAKTASLQETFVGRLTQVDWQAAPPPVRRTEDAGATPSAPEVADDAAPKPASGILVSVPPKKSEPEVDPVRVLAEDSPEAQRGLNSIAELLARIDHTRRLLIAWDRAGKYFRDPKRGLAKRSEEKDLSYRMEQVFELIDDYPKFVGQPGKPGYRVVALARLQMTAPMFKSIDPPHRHLLAKDWREGRRLLLAHRQYVRRRFHVLRHSSAVGRWLHRIVGTVWDHRYWVAAGLLIVAAMVLYFTW